MYSDDYDNTPEGVIEAICDADNNAAARHQQLIQKFSDLINSLRTDAPQQPSPMKDDRTSELSEEATKLAKDMGWSNGW